MAASSTTVSSAGPSRPAPNFLERLRGGDEVAYVITFMAAASILLITGAAGLRAVHQLRRCPREIRLGLPVYPNLGPGERSVRRAALHLRNAGDVLPGAAHGNPARRRRRHLSSGVSAAENLRRTHVLDRTAGRRPQRDLRTARNFRAGPHPALSRTVPARRPRLDPVLQRPLLRRQPVFSRRGAGRDDHSRSSSRSPAK